MSVSCWKQHFLGISILILDHLHVHGLVFGNMNVKNAQLQQKQVTYPELHVLQAAAHVAGDLGAPESVLHCLPMPGLLVGEQGQHERAGPEHMNMHRMFFQPKPMSPRFFYLT